MSKNQAKRAQMVKDVRIFSLILLGLLGLGAWSLLATEAPPIEMALPPPSPTTPRQPLTNQVSHTPNSLSPLSPPLLYLPLIRIPANEPVLFGEIHTGEGTYYAATGAGNCLFDPSPGNLMVAALNQVDYNNAALCGAYIQVTGPEGSAVVRIVDRCPGCPVGDVDLSYVAFDAIANPADGRVPIQWQLISPPLEGPIIFHFKEGSNPYWTAVQVRNHRNPILRFEYLAAGSGYQEVPRMEYNYFVASSGMGDGPYTFRVTDSLGHVIISQDVVFIENGEVPGSGQFPPP